MIHGGWHIQSCHGNLPTPLHIHQCLQMKRESTVTMCNEVLLSSGQASRSHNVPIWHWLPVNPAGHRQKSGETHSPPFSQGKEHTAVGARKKKRNRWHGRDPQMLLMMPLRRCNSFTRNWGGIYERAQHVTEVGSSCHWDPWLWSQECKGHAWMPARSRFVCSEFQRWRGNATKIN